MLKIKTCLGNPRVQSEAAAVTWTASHCFVDFNGREKPKRVLRWRRDEDSVIGVSGQRSRVEGRT